ncbi:18S rRNA maturation protein [Coemansia sp. Benny D115]|nr:18S rRNA maturation protein [Coemansia sp. Benny D115]
MPKSAQNDSGNGGNRYESQDSVFKKAQQSSTSFTGRKPYDRKSAPQKGDKGGKPDKQLNTEMPKSMGQCKKQLRDLNRRLNNTKHPMTSLQRREIEQRIKALELLQSQMTDSRVMQSNATKYHKVKFVERKKVLRNLQRVSKAIAEKETEALLDEKRELLINLNYTTYYPDEVKYISIYPAENSQSNEVTEERRKTIRGAIWKAMQDGKLPMDSTQVPANDRKAIRRNNRLLLRTVSLAHGLKVQGGDDDSDVDEKQDSKAAGAEEDEFFE